MNDYEERLNFLLSEADRIKTRLAELQPAKDEIAQLEGDMLDLKSESKLLISDIQSNFEL